MIAKLVAWGDTRTEAIDRLRRALEEYRVVGVRTTVPFFQWILEQPDFADGRFDTTYLDRVLVERKGLSFVTAGEIDVRDATLAVALASWFRAHGAVAASPPRNGGAWRRAARVESVRIHPP
jgi:acetyl/propionyl-CoA carboxylase alpha subunit